MAEIRMVEARRVRALDDARLEIVFDDDTRGVLDLTDFLNLGPMTEPLRDPPISVASFIEMAPLTWPNGRNLDPINAQMDSRSRHATGGERGGVIIYPGGCCRLAYRKALRRAAE